MNKNNIINETSPSFRSVDAISFDTESEWLRHEILLPEGYIFKDENGNVINATKIVLEKKNDDKLKLDSTKTVREYWSEYTRIFIEIYDDEPHECVLTHLYTLESHRQKGYARKALTEAELIAKELGCHTAYLKVETDSWMHQWYLRIGYKWYKTVDKEYTWLIKNLTGIEKKKKEYPKTYEECAEIVKVGKERTLEGEIIRKNNYKIDLLESFQKILICRDAYWKIAGEELGLNRPWEPDYDSGVNKYGIICMNGVVQESNPTTNWERHLNKNLDFPTEEMRDAFKENFDPDIEICKEFL